MVVMNGLELLDDETLARVLSAALSTGAEFAEIFASDWRGTGVGLDDGRIEQLSTGRNRGAGIRVIAGETTGFAHTADLSEAGLIAAARVAADAARQGGGGTRVISLDERARRVVSPIDIDPSTIGKAAKVDLLRRVDEAARSAGGAITQVSAGYSDGRTHIVIANSDGVLARDERIRTLLRVSAVANGDTGMQTGFDSLGHTMGFELFDKVSVEEVARTAANRALTKLKARPAPSGSMPVVIKAGSGGVLFHEACGHGLEADLVSKGASVYKGKVGELVASPLVTLVDDGTMTHEWGAIAFDDEGHPSQYKIGRAHV